LKELKEKKSLPNFKDATLFWIQLGFISFGGPAGQIAMMHETIVEKKLWLSEKKFLDALNFCILLPGPEAQQLATYIGWLLHGTKGGLIAGIFFILPSCLFLWMLSIIYVKFHTILIINNVLYGLKIAIVGIVLTATIRIAKKALHSKFKWLVAILCFLTLTFLHLSLPVLAIMLLAFGWIIPYPKNYKEIEKKNFIIRENTKSKEIFHLTKSFYFIKITIIFSLLGIIPWLLMQFFFDNYTFWNQLILFFSKSALVTFGGAYSILPYVADQSVNHFHWLSYSEMIDGLALGETTPGPLVIVLSFVGFMAGYTIFSGNIFLASLSLVVTTYYTFLPSFYFIFAGAPFVEKLMLSERLKSAMEMVTSGVVGMMASFCWHLIFVVCMHSNNFQVEDPTIDYFSIFWIVLSIYFLYFRKLNIILWIMISSLVGGIFNSIYLLYSFR
jgi:chromate transporter